MVGPERAVWRLDASAARRRQRRRRCRPADRWRRAPAQRSAQARRDTPRRRCGDDHGGGPVDACRCSCSGRRHARGTDHERGSRLYARRFAHRVFGLGIDLPDLLPRPPTAQWNLDPVVTHTAARQPRIRTGVPRRREHREPYTARGRRATAQVRRGFRRLRRVPATTSGIGGQGKSVRIRRGPATVTEDARRTPCGSHWAGAREGAEGSLGSQETRLRSDTSIALAETGQKAHASSSRDARRRDHHPPRRGLQRRGRAGRRARAHRGRDEHDLRPRRADRRPRRARELRQRQARRCDGTNAGAATGPGPTATAAAVDALATLGQAFDGQWYPGFDDYYVAQLGPEREDNDAAQWWGVLVNRRFTPLGGCQRPGPERRRGAVGVRRLLQPPVPVARRAGDRAARRAGERRRHRDSLEHVERRRRRGRRTPAPVVGAVGANGQPAPAGTADAARPPPTELRSSSSTRPAGSA